MPRRNRRAMKPRRPLAAFCGTLTARRTALVEGRHATIEEPSQIAGCARRGADINSRAGHSVGGCALAVLEERVLAGVGADDLEPQRRRGWVGYVDRAGADDL